MLRFKMSPSFFIHVGFGLVHYPVFVLGCSHLSDKYDILTAFLFHLLIEMYAVKMYPYFYVLYKKI